MLSSAGLTCDPYEGRLDEKVLDYPGQEGCVHDGDGWVVVLGDTEEVVIPLINRLLGGEFCSLDFFETHELLSETFDGGGGRHSIVAGQGWAVTGAGPAEMAAMARATNGRAFTADCLP